MCKYAGEAAPVLQCMAIELWIAEYIYIVAAEYSGWDVSEHTCSHLHV